MKISNAHYAHMKFAIAKIPANDVKAHHKRIASAKGNVQMRLRWDLAYQAGLSQWFCDEVYPYANDDHIDTALRSIMRELYGV